MGFSIEDREKAMIACGRACSICHKFCGIKMEAHHIEPEAVSNDNTYSNLIPLCFDCHADAGHYNDQHPKGIKYKPSELRKHRDNWYKKVLESGAFLESTEFIELDKATYKTLSEFLPQEQFEFLRDANLDGAEIRRGFFDPLEIFDRYKRLDPHLEYIDADLEKAKSNLADGIREFRHEYLPVTQPSKYSSGHIIMPIEQFSRAANCDELREAKIDKLEKVATKVWERYCEYIQICRRKLKV